ncbi:MAG: hypothetical protein KKH44_07835 [Bacteroidetes bacterium]|nr:hypothetical protein [Bacteroidota bacterium]
MQTIQKEYKVYSFDELSKEVKEKGISDNYDINGSYDWWNDTYEDAKDIGLEITSFDLDRNRHAAGNFILAANEVAQNIFNEHGEHCETYKTADDFMDKWQPVFDNYMQTEEGEDELMELEDEFLKSLLEDYSIMLQNEYEYLSSEEAIKETIEANEYTFLEDGEMFNV